MTLTEFLLARIAEDEADADKDEVMDRGFHSGTCGLLWVADYLEPECTCAMRTRMLAECEAKRRIMEHCEPDPLTKSPGDEYVLCLLALPYADHPDYREEWRP